MANKKQLTGMLVLALVLGLVVAGCTTTNALITGSNTGTIPVVDVAAKDFTTVGLVFAEVEVLHRRRADSVTASGEVLTYYALLQEAQKLGADAIVNVTIDTKREMNSAKTKFLIFTVSDTEEQKDTFYGSALAIRYTGKLVEGDISSKNAVVSTSANRSSVESDGSSSERKWYNPFTWFK